MTSKKKINISIWAVLQIRNNTHYSNLRKIEKDILRQGLEVLESILDEHGIVHSKVFEQDFGRRRLRLKI